MKFVLSLEPKQWWDDTRMTVNGSNNNNNKRNESIQQQYQIYIRNRTNITFDKINNTKINKVIEQRYSLTAQRLFHCRPPDPWHSLLGSGTTHLFFR